ncbi:WD repeat-containing protein 87-like [Ochotona princeps]|uniref:WD repeat-containing protein 87-like n=1 Tax=Ochotona princeps TaxID=9978 RepID=UPI00271554F6|nr:WD repeat-containing protein 87-like [Ochotona princeps]
MCSNRWNGIKKSSSPRFIPKWKNLKLLISDILKDTETDEESKNNAVVLSDWPEILYQESQHPKNKAFICFYSINGNYFVSLDWVEPCENQVQAVLWILKKDTENKEVLEKLKFHVMVQVPPIKAMVHTGSYHTLIAYCGDMRLWLFRDHQRAFTFLGTVPCRFSISCLCYDSETKMLLCGTTGAVITWFLLPNGRELQLAQTVPLTGPELVQSFSLNGPQGSMLALCENAVRVFTHQGQGQLKEVKKFTLVTSGSSITCSFTCVSQGTFYAGTRAGEVHAWALERGNFLHSFQAHLSSVICVHSRPETHTLLTAGGEGVMREWNLASGSLLRQLTIDQDLQQLQFIDEITVFCQSTSAFSLHRLPYFYNLFHVCGSAPQQVQRVCCGHNWNRIFCATEDGLLRFLSPVTGDLLVITWPLLVMDKAVAWAFDSARQELFVATGGSEVLVFDATRSPCTAKYLVCLSGNSTDRVRCLAYGRSPLGKRLDGLMFCGHESGIVRILSHHNFARTEKIVHSGAVLTLCTLENPQEKSLLCSYGKDNIVHLTEAVFQENKVILQPFNKMICVCPLKHVKLLPDSVGAITETSCWQLWHYQDFLTSSESKKSSPFTQTKCLHECAITSFDACYSLKLFVTGGVDGSVRIWDFLGRLVTELDSAFHFGPLCFANNRGDLLLTFNQSIYIVSCLKLLPPTQLIDLGNLNTEDEVQEVPKPFLPSFFFLFEKVLVPKFCYLGQGLQEIQGLEILINKRAIAFDHTVPHVVEEDPQTSFVSQERSKWSFMEEKDIDICTPDRLPFVAPAQLQLAGWEGFNVYHIVRRFFGKGQAWPFTPDGYIPNSVIRACLWPQGTLVFLSCDLYSLYKDKDMDMTELLRFQALPPETPEDEKVSLSKQKAKFKEWQGSSFELESVAKQNWMGRKFSEGIIENLIEKILSLTIYCSVEEYKKYFSVLAQIFATYQIPSRLCTDTACQLLKDTIHSNPHIRELAWEMLERLGIMNRCFVIPLTMGLMDVDKNVRTKVLHLLRRVTGIQTKTMLIRVLKKSETLQEMQMEIIGDSSLGQLMDIQDSDIQRLHTQVEQRLNENLTMSHKDRSFSFSLDLSIEDQLKSFDEETIIPLSETLKISKWREMKKRVQAKNKTLIKKDLRVAKKPRKAELRKIASVLVISEDVAEQREEVAEQREAKRSEQFDTQDVALEPKLPLSTFIPVTPKIDDKEKEVVLEVMESTESLVVTEDVEPTDQPRMEDETQVISKMKKQDRVKELWKRAIKKGYAIAIMLRKEKEDTKDISEAITKESMEELIQVSEQQKDKRKKPGKKVHGVAGTPGRIGKLDTSSWRNDISYLVTSRIASSNPDMLKDLSKELVDLARVMLAGQQPSWDLFQEICPFLEDSKSLSSKLDDRVVEETETAVIEDIKEEEKVIPRGKGDKPSKTQKVKKVSFLEDHLALEKRKFKAAVRKPAKQEGELVKEEREPTKKKLIQGKEKLTKDEKNLIHPEEKMAPEEEIPAFSQKKLTTEEQMLVLEERRLTGKEREPLAKETKGIQEEGKPFLEWEETIQAQEQSIQTREERQLSQKKKELGKKEEPVSEEDKLSWEKENLTGEELTWEEEELSGEEEELTPGIEKQFRTLPGVALDIRSAECASADRPGTGAVRRIRSRSRAFTRREGSRLGGIVAWLSERGILAECEGHRVEALW